MSLAANMLEGGSLRPCGSLCSSRERRWLQPRPDDNLPPHRPLGSACDQGGHVFHRDTHSPIDGLSQTLGFQEPRPREGRWQPQVEWLRIGLYRSVAGPQRVFSFMRFLYRGLPSLLVFLWLSAHVSSPDKMRLEKSTWLTDP